MVRGKLMRCLPAVAVLLALCRPAMGEAPLPALAPDRHLGVASCAASVCHGKTLPDAHARVRLDEYRDWLHRDAHSRAFRTLQTAQSRAIAAKLGLDSAETARVCLDCHADNVASELRGPRFQLSDGVGCEACHGGAGRWLATHTEKDRKHADNLAEGMYPSADPAARARLCLSCHLGNDKQFATHRIMGAGHPRLVFDLAAFGSNQPAHVEFDDDYRARKGATAPVNIWLSGLLELSQQTLALLQSHWFTQSGLMPELALFQCHACHHPMNDRRWRDTYRGADIPPGAVRLNDAALLVLATVLQALQPPQGGALLDGISRLQQAALADRAAVAAQARALQDLLQQVAGPVLGANHDPAALQHLRQSILQQAARQRFRDFTAAELAFLAVETLSLALGDEDKLRTPLDAWFATVSDENSFNPARFASAAHQLAGAL